MSSDRPAPFNALDFQHVCAISTRWMDNDVYGHINNVVYYSFFDTVVADYLIAQGALDFIKGDTIGLVVETKCSYFAPIAFPDRVRAGLRVAHLGTSSVRYEIGIFRNDETTASAQGYFVHVYVDRASNRPVKLPEKFRTALQKLVRA
ncbi:MAG: thioesterase family protein [Hyphomicrobiales bacterium]|nr:thioesterase family protein [Hyphomicrobiales bacterium]